MSRHRLPIGFRNVMEATPFDLPGAGSSNVSSSVSRFARDVSLAESFALVVSPGWGRDEDPDAGERLTPIRASAQTSWGRELLWMNHRKG